MKKILAQITMILLAASSYAKEFTYLNVEQICKEPFTDDAILRKDPLFIDDFLTLHSLLKITQPSSVFEIGTCTGEGTLIIKNAIGDGKLYSLDLPPNETSYDIPKVGGKCYLPYEQIIGNSLSLNYSDYFPLEAWFIDGAHEYSHVFYETQEALKSAPKIIIWHDADIPEVFEGIKDGLELDQEYVLFRVLNTRIAFSVPTVSNFFEVLND